MKATAPMHEIERISQELRNWNITPEKSVGLHKVVIGLVGDTKTLNPKQIQQISPYQLNPAEIVSVTFSVTQDLDALFPASIARRRPGWKQVPMIDVQQMQITNDLEHCIRVLIHLNTSMPQNALRPAYLRFATQLRPDIAFSS